MSRASILLSLLAVLALAGCGDGEPTGTAGDGTAGTSEPASTTGAATAPPGSSTPEAGRSTTTGGEPDDTSAPGESSTSTGATAGEGSGVVAVQLEEVGGFFVEGFEIGLRFETAGGDVIGSTLWSDYVQSLGAQDIEAYYDTVMEQVVPAGELVVLATVNVGIGPAPEVPDLDGDLDCRLGVEMPDGGRVEVEVSFGGGGDCLRVL
jgi:hypothetical protein